MGVFGLLKSERYTFKQWDISRLNTKGMLDFIFLVFLSVVPLRNLAQYLTFREYANEAYVTAVPFLSSQMESAKGIEW